MLRRTHLIISLAVALYFIPHINHGILNVMMFFAVIFASTVLPDIDSGFSALGKNWFSKPVQAVVSHRGILHSYTFCLVLSFFLAWVYPPLALPFFLGYGFHLLADSFTSQGIKPFWPLKAESKGVVRTGGVVEDTIFWSFVAICILSVVLLFA